ncbi:MAG: polysaccharide deacetylase family protein [Bacteroidales bacterium]|nr:polysaccharide deacetylase family protein [Bacteroidales bacterium]
MKLIKPPNIIKKIYKNVIWNISNEKNQIFLTIDDCSDYEATIEVLDILDDFNVKATFFCIGKYIEVSKLHLTISEKGHAVANHGYEHIDGFKTNFDDYVSNVYKCSQIIDSDLFRPPYGKITHKQYKSLNKSFKIVMWDVLSYDFDEQTSPIQCLENVKNNFLSGSIIVFHANKKSRKNMLFALPIFLEYINSSTFEFSLINTNIL